MGRDISPEPEIRQLLGGLRDFFMAANEAELRRAYESVAGVTALGTSSVSQAAVIDWEQTLFGFNRLFVGPMALLAPPFASVWLEPEPLLMGKSTLDARHVYQMLGLQTPQPNKLPDDHVSLELDALLAMQTAMEQAHSIELRELWRFFLQRHVLLWMPRFCARILELESTPPAVAAMAGELSTWLEAVQNILACDEGPAAAVTKMHTTPNKPEVR